MAVAVAPEIAVGQSIEELDLKVIVPAPDNPRRDLGDVTELAASMSELGMLQPLVVTPRGGKFMVVCGHRRLAGAKKAKLAKAPAIIRSLTEPQRIKAMLIENCQREDLSLLEESRAYAQLVELGETQRQIASSVGKTQSHVSKRLQLLDLPEKVLAEVDSGRITIGDALDLAALKAHPKHMKRVLDRPGWQTVRYAIEQANAEIKREEAVKAAAAKLKAKGITPVKLDQWGQAKPPMKTLGKRWGQIDVDLKAHQKLDCHAYGVTRDGKILDVCTTPENHPEAAPKTPEYSYEPSPEAKRREKEQAESQATADRRLEFISSIANGKITKDDLLDISLFALYDCEGWQAFGWTCRMLKVPLAGPIIEARAAETVEEAETALERDPYDGLEPHDAMPALTAYAGESATNMLRASFAARRLLDRRAGLRPVGRLGPARDRALRRP